MSKKKISGTMPLVVGIILVGVFSIALTSCDNFQLWGVSLSETGTYTFPGAAVGYGKQTPLSVTVRNHNSEIVHCRIYLSGPHTHAFEGDNAGGLIGIWLGGTMDFDSSNRHTFTIYPVTGLSEGIYTATVSVETDEDESASFDVSFTVY